jgi:hypothetical protein
METTKIAKVWHRTFLALAVCAAIGSGLALLTSCAQQSGTGGANGSVAPAAEGPRRAAFGETVTRLAERPIPNIPGKRLVVDAVDYARAGTRPRTVTPARRSSTPTSSRVRSGARSMASRSGSTGPARCGSSAPAPTIG